MVQAPNMPHYSHATRIKKILPVTLASPIGQGNIGIPSIRSEYQFFSQHPENSNTQIQFFIEQALSTPWHQLWLSDIPTHANEYPLIQSAFLKHKLPIDTLSTTLAYGVDTHNNNWQGYLNGLGKNTRLQVYNRRKNLEQLGDVQLCNAWPNLNEFINLLNTFHQKRWGKPVYSGTNLHFIQQLLPALNAQGHYIDLSVLSLNQKPLAAVLDIHINGHVYNLQSGFNENFHPKISLGSLHFGYKIEAAFNAPHLDYYDFLAGHGRSTNYKKQLATASVELATLCCTRSKWLKTLDKTYRLYQRLTHKTPEAIT